MVTPSYPWQTATLRAETKTLLDRNSTGDEAVSFQSDGAADRIWVGISKSTGLAATDFVILTANSVPVALLTIHTPLVTLSYGEHGDIIRQVNGILVVGGGLNPLVTVVRSTRWRNDGVQ